MIRPHVALSAGSRLARDRDRTCMPGVATGAGSNGAVGIGFANAVALFAATGHRRSTFELHERVRRPPGASGLIGLRQVHHLRSESFFPIHRRPGGRGMAAMEELLVDLLVATAAISGGQAGRRNREAMMVFLLLALCRLMTVQTVHAFLRMLAQFVFVNDRVL